MLWGPTCPGSGPREGVRASDVWPRGTDSHAASSSRNAVVASGSALPIGQRRPNGEKKERFIFTRLPESDLALRQQENGNRSAKHK